MPKCFGTAASVDLFGWLIAGFSAAGHSQTHAPPPSFEVATVKVSKPCGPVMGDLLPGGQLQLRNLSLRLLVLAAWGVKDFAVTGGPAWMESDCLEIVGKSASNRSREDLLQMLLREGFRMMGPHRPID